MATASQLIALVRSHAVGDAERFLDVATQVAADAERKGQSRLAAELKALIDETRRLDSHQRPSAAPIPLFRPRGELAGLVKANFPTTRLSDLVLPRDLTNRLLRILRENQERLLLEEKGLEPRRKFLLVGPPGTGKTMTASAIAAELSLPLLSILLDGVITKFMGETASKLRVIFDAMQTQRAVYFFDEVDALAARRAAENDIGEARRMLNSFLQFLEDDTSSSIIIAATNHPELLDPAIFRRFHGVLDYPLPDFEGAKRVLTTVLANFQPGSLDWARIEGAVGALSPAELTLAARDAARTAVLDGCEQVATSCLLDALGERSAAKR